VDTAALIKAGEVATRQALPAIKKWLETPLAVSGAKAVRTLVQAATMPAD